MSGRPASPKEVAAWCLYDFANSAFALSILAVLFNRYFAEVVAGGEEGVRLSWGSFSYQLPGASFFAFTVAVGMFLVAVVAPLLGAIADFSASKKRFLAWFCLLGVVSTALLYFVREGTYWRGAILFILALIGFDGSIVFYNAFLTEIADPKRMGWISGLGWAAGYIGGSLLLILNLLMLEYPHALGFPPGSFRVQHCFVSVGIWWLLFALPLFFWLRERAEPVALPPGVGYGRAAFERVAATLRKIRNYRQLAKFLVSFLIYNDGIETVILMASIFGSQVLRMGEQELIVFFLMVQGMAFVGAILLGLVADRIGNRNTVLMTLSVWTAVVVWTWKIGWLGDPRAEFWGLGVAVGLVLGGSQSASRALQGTFTPKEASAEFFGFFAISGKFSSVLGPLTYGGIVAVTGDLRSGILSVALFFIVGMILLALVDEREGRERSKLPPEQA